MDTDALIAWFTHTTLLGLPLANWSLAAAATIASYLTMTLVLRWILRRAALVAQHTRNRVDDTVVELLAGTNRWLLALACVLIGLGLLDLPARWNARVGQLWFVALMLQVALWCNTAVTLGLRRFSARHANAGTAQGSASTTLLSWGLRTALWAVVVLAMLSNVGVNITAFVASLGVGGIAVALAVQNILGDLFASLAIAIDKPFEVGDAIGVNGMSGTVEQVGLKTTRIRAPGGEQIVMSNADLLKNAVSNYKRLAERRVVFKFRLSYATTPEQAAAVPGVVQRIVASSDKLRFDRAHLQALGESSLDYEAVYIVLVADYQLYMDLQQRVILELMRELKRLGVDFAFPTRTVFLGGDAAAALAARPPEPAAA